MLIFISIIIAIPPSFQSIKNQALKLVTCLYYDRYFVWL
jgi:hypothetical protein